MSAQLEAVRLAAAEVFTPEGVELWMGAANSLLDWRSPIDLVEAGQADRVLGLLEALATGAVL